MNDGLLESTDLLAEKRMEDAYKALVNRSPGYCSHQQEAYCDDCGIPGSLADIAFEMRDACDRIAWVHMLGVIKGGYTPSVLTMARNTAAEWIVAATLAWEASNDTKRS